jgi:hypothetical protein
MGRSETVIWHTTRPAGRHLAWIGILLTSCSSIRNASLQIEESHNALYMQKALVVYAREDKKVWLTNPTHTRCYYLKGKQFAQKWEPGDTLIIDQNLDDFYRLKFSKQCP